MAKSKTATPAAANAQTYSFRVIVRGANKDGARVRRVRTIQATDAGHAFELAGPIAEEASKGLDQSGLFINVYPPVGQLCNGGISKGFVVTPDGFLVKESA